MCSSHSIHLLALRAISWNSSHLRWNTNLRHSEFSRNEVFNWKSRHRWSVFILHLDHSRIDWCVDEFLVLTFLSSHVSSYTHFFCFSNSFFFSGSSFIWSNEHYFWILKNRIEHFWTACIVFSCWFKVNITNSDCNRISCNVSFKL